MRLHLCCIKMLFCFVDHHFARKGSQTHPAVPGFLLKSVFFSDKSYARNLAVFVVVYMSSPQIQHLSSNSLLKAVQSWWLTHIYLTSCHHWIKHTKLISFKKAYGLLVLCFFFSNSFHLGIHHGDISLLSVVESIFVHKHMQWSS